MVKYDVLLGAAGWVRRELSRSSDVVLIWDFLTLTTRANRFKTQKKETQKSFNLGNS